MRQIEYERGKEIIRECTCICGAGLTLAWGGAWGINSYVLRCRDDPLHEGIARPATLGPYDIPGFNLFNLKRRKEQMVGELGQEKATRLMKYEGVVSLTKPQAMEILRTIWPKAPETEVLKAAMVCSQYGLNPLMKHVFLIPFKRKEKGVVVGEEWVTVLGIKSNRLIAQRPHHYSYLDLTPRAMTEEEQRKILGEVDDSRVWAITMLKDLDTGAEAIGIGSWARDEVPYGAEKGNTKLNMACIRSERQALDRQYPGEMPQGVAVLDEEYLSGDVVEGEALDLDERGRQPQGEVTEGKFAAEAEKRKTTGTEKADAANFHEAETSPKPARASAARDPAKIITISDLYKACNEDFVVTGEDGELRKMQPADVNKELNVSSASEITELPRDCYLRIRAARQ